MDLSHLPGFPMWERGVFEILQPCWPTMRSIFHFYCRRGNHNSALPPHRMGLSAFLLWSEDCRLRTKQFSHARILAIFHYCVLSRVNRAWVSALDFEDGAALVDKVKGGGVLKDDELELLRCFASSETTSPDTEPLSIGFAAFVEGLIRCSFLRANLKWHPGFEDISSMHITPLPGCLQRFLHDCVLRFSHRAGLTFSRRLLGDAHFGEAVAQRQVQLESLCSKLAAVDSLPAFDDPVRLPIAIDNARALFQEGGLLGQTVVRIPRAGSEARVVTSSLNEQQFNDAWNDSRTFVRGCVGPEPSESEQVQGLSQQEFVEVVARCAQHKYVEVSTMSMAQRFLAVVDSLVGERTPEDAIRTAIRAQPQRVFDASLEHPPEDWSTDELDTWLSIWRQLDLSKLPSYPDWLRPTFLTLRGGLRKVLSIFATYTRNGDMEGSLSAEGWLRFTREAALVTRALDADRLSSIFVEASVTTKMGEQVLRAPQFIQALVHVASWRSNPMQDQSTFRSKLVPIPRCIDLLMKHIFAQLMDGAMPVRSLGSSGPRGQPGALQESAVKRFDGLLPAFRTRLYKKCMKAWFDITQASRVVDRKIVTSIWKQNVTKLTSTTFYAWKFYMKVWRKVVRYTGLILQPLLPFSVHSAFQHWKRQRRLPKLMTATSIWFVEHAGSAEPVNPTMQRSWSLACAFHQWVCTRHWALCEMDMVVHVKSRVATVLLSNVIDAWARLTIKSDRPPAEPAVRHQRETDETEGLPASGLDEQHFLNDKLLPRGPRVRLGAQTWSSLESELQLSELPGAQAHMAAIHSMLHESLADTWCIFRHYAKLFIRPSHGISELFSLKLNEWLLLFEDAQVFGPMEPKKQEAMAQVFEEAQRRHRRGCAMTLAHFLEALVYASAPQGELTGPDCLSKLLSQLTPLLAKDFAPGFRAAFWGDTKVVHLLRRHNAALRGAWVARGWYPHGASLAAIEADMLDLGLVCDNYSVELHGLSGCFLSLSIEQVKEAFVDSLDLAAGGAMGMQDPRLSFEGWLECMGRCALGLYGPIELLKLHHLVDCVLRNVLQGNTIEAAVDSVWMEVRGDIRSWNAEPAARGEDIAALAAAETAATAGGGKRAASPASVPKKGGKRGKKGKRSKSLSASSVVGILALGQQSLSAKATLSDGGGKAGTVQVSTAMFCFPVPCLARCPRPDPPSPLPRLLAPRLPALSSLERASSGLISLRHSAAGCRSGQDSIGLSSNARAKAGGRSRTGRKTDPRWLAHVTGKDWPAQACRGDGSA